MKTFKDVAHLYLGCIMQHKTGGTSYLSPNLLPNVFGSTFDNYTPILRPLADMTEEESIQVAEICFPKKQTRTKRVFRNYGHLKQVSIMGGTSFENKLSINTAVFSIYCGGIGENSVPNYQLAFVYLLSKHFDLFGLIKSGEAIDATTL